MNELKKYVFLNLKKYVFLDDVRNINMDAVPDYWKDRTIVVRTAEEAIKMIEDEMVDYISFDHDLGTTLTGYDVAKVIEQRAYRGFKPPYYAIHSANPVGKRNINAAMQTANRLFRKFVNRNVDQ